MALLALMMIPSRNAYAQMTFPRVNRDSLNNLTAADYSDMKAKLGIRELRPGKDGYSTDPAIGANYDEFIANPYLNYPDPLVTFDGRTVKNKKMWYGVRRPELVQVFEDEFYGHLPENLPGVNVGLMGGRLAFRMHDGGHEPGPNWPYFLDFFDRFVVKK